MKLAARFGAESAIVVDLDAPVKTRVGYRILADFPRLEYADGALAHEMSAAPELLADLRRASRLIEWMAPYIGRIAPGDYADCYADLNEHFIRAPQTIAKAESRS